MTEKRDDETALLASFFSWPCGLSFPPRSLAKNHDLWGRKKWKGDPAKIEPISLRNPAHFPRGNAPYKGRFLFHAAKDHCRPPQRWFIFTLMVYPLKAMMRPRSQRGPWNKTPDDLWLMRMTEKRLNVVKGWVIQGRKNIFANPSIEVNTIYHWWKIVLKLIYKRNGAFGWFLMSQLAFFGKWAVFQQIVLVFLDFLKIWLFNDKVKI